jgi:hypothetical protein
MASDKPKITVIGDTLVMETDADLGWGMCETRLQQLGFAMHIVLQTCDVYTDQMVEHLGEESWNEDLEDLRAHLDVNDLVIMHFMKVGGVLLMRKLRGDDEKEHEPKEDEAEEATEPSPHGTSTWGAIGHTDWDQK